MLYWHRNADHDPANIWMRKLIIEASRGKVADPAADRSSSVKVRRTAGETRANEHCERPLRGYIAGRGPATGHLAMRPEIEKLVEEIKQSVGLLRRHL